MKERPSLIEGAEKELVYEKEYRTHLRSAFEGASKVLAQSGQEVRGGGVNRLRKYVKVAGTLSPEFAPGPELRMTLEARSPLASARKIRMWIQGVGPLTVKEVVGKKDQETIFRGELHNTYSPAYRKMELDSDRGWAEVAKTFSDAIGRFKPHNP